MSKYIGLDVHKNKCHATIMSEDGEIQKQEEFKNDTLGLGLFFDGIDDAQIAMEATYSWQPTYQWLEEKGYDVKLAHPKKLELLAKQR
ncbi:hypothetical protein AKJ47_02505 [candidate division MSBL1 archaeon SCGC-AAA261G05]|uniref:Transposase IS110-like N-terminal domain-containing protein n=1 Tax=candidate division MSBL1 archaeon SCGC-AAA261G05 TaxID=1698276 RepID=A0A133VA44_9EURY|nr:hypothetical protein AKJ47_02505 [candidate division MSBL1 archaeon SCGC-AAA261G05]